VVFTWDPAPAGDLGPTPSGSEEWQGTLIVYTNGVAAATNASAGYAANIQVPADVPSREPADLAVGSYNRASGLTEEFEGDIDEVALYNNVLLSPDQVLAHYMTGTNSHPATNYETLVMTAGGELATPPIPERVTLPATYLRFSEPAYFPAANSGSLGYLANGSLVLTTNISTGPVTVGFESPNQAVPVNGTNSWVSLNNPSGLNISGQITLEAWINPDAVATTTNGTNVARIISHGPPTPTFYDPNAFAFTLSGSQLSSNEVFLRIEAVTNGATYVNYVVGTSDGTTFHGASSAVPGAVLGGGQWVHLVGTYDGANWKLYRNGVQIASAVSVVGALPVSDAEWAIGATGNGWGDFLSGGIDEAAIYGTALPAGKIKAHYYVGQSGAVSLSIVRNSDGSVTVTWPGGVLQQADNVGGPYTNVQVSGNPATSPYNTTPGTRKFYRACL